MSPNHRTALRQALAYGTLAALVLICLHLMRTSYLLWDLSLELYLLGVGIPLMALGIILGRSLDRKSPPPKPKTDLSNKELAVLTAVAEGLSNQQIAERLFVSVSTVKTHLRNVYAKLNVQRRTQAVERARRLDLLP